MTDNQTFACPSCGASYRLKLELAGKRVKCRKCSQIIQIPEPALEQLAEQLEEVLEELEEIEELPEPVAERKPTARTARSRASGGRASSRRGRSRPVEAKTKTPVILGGIGLVAAIVIAFVVTGNGDGDGVKKPGEPLGKATGGSTAKTSTQAPTTTPVEKTQPEKTPREIIDETLSAAAATSDRPEKVALLWKAAAMRRGIRLDDVETAQAICSRIIAIAPGHADARKALGHSKYDGILKHRHGDWVTAENKGEFANLEKQFRADEVKRIERERWTTDAFARKCAKVRDNFIEDVKDVPKLDLKFYFDIPEVPRPYFLMVEDVVNPDSEQTAKLIGPGLAALRKAFHKAYGDGIVAAWDDEEYVVPVMVLKDKSSYENYRDHGHAFFPSTGFAAAFYTPRPFGKQTKGILYTWQGGNESRFYHSLFHEAVHQLMHNSCASIMMGNTPWLEEGIAEYFGAHTGNISRPDTYRFGTVLKSRYSAVQESCQAMLVAFKAGKRKGAFMTPKQMLELPRDKFQYYKGLLDGGRPEKPGDKAVARRVVDTIYAQGWAWSFFCYNYEGGLYREAFELLLKDELRYEYHIDKVAEYFGAESDEDWDELAKQFAVFVLRKMRHLSTPADPTKKD